MNIAECPWARRWPMLTQKSRKRSITCGRGRRGRPGPSVREAKRVSRARRGRQRARRPAASNACCRSPCASCPCSSDGERGASSSCGCLKPWPGLSTSPSRPGQTSRSNPRGGDDALDGVQAAEDRLELLEVADGDLKGVHGAAVLGGAALG